MIYPYQGQYPYNEDVVSGWNSTAIGVYYCGLPTTIGLRPLYIGVGAGDTGMRGRLLDHLREDYWPDVTHFGYHQCSTAEEAKDLETQEILRCRPKYNTQGK